MRAWWLISGSLVLGFALGAGFTLRIKNAEKEPVSSVHNLDYYISDESFSEVHNAKAVLAGLSRKFLVELRSSAWVEARESRRKQSRSGENLSPTASLILALENGIQEFKGTEQELGLIPDLLRALKANGQFGRWLEIYLAALYTHPTDELVLTFARDALQIGIRTGRQEDVVNALRHVCSIPLEFASKAGLQSTMRRLFPYPSIAHHEHSSHEMLVENPEKLSIIR
jgi:hypothetical protein